MSKINLALKWDGNAESEKREKKAQDVQVYTAIGIFLTHFG